MKQVENLRACSDGRHVRSCVGCRLQKVQMVSFQHMLMHHDARLCRHVHTCDTDLCIFSHTLCADVEPAPAAARAWACVTQQHNCHLPGLSSVHMQVTVTYWMVEEHVVDDGHADLFQPA